MKLSPFTKRDWDGFAGAERFTNGDEPNIGEFDNPLAIVIQDNHGIQIIFVGEDLDDVVYDLTATRRLSDMVVAQLTEADMTPETLTELGFERL